jgi:nicotinate-nucleotide adenylyltransferase
MNSLYPQPTLYNAAAYRSLRVGLFGGSFNPAHAAHRQLAERALEALDLDVVWWLVSPQNPLKSSDDMAPLAARMKSAQQQITGPRMVVTDIESQLGTQYTADAIRELKKHFPYTEFTWMMGADSLRTFHHWEKWRDISRAVPIAVFARPPQQIRALSGFAAKTLRQSRRKHHGKTGWSYVMMPLNPISATEIRAQHAHAKKS